MILYIYITILSYFLLGGIGFYFINRRKDHETAHKSMIKFITYFFIIHTLFASIVFEPIVFHYLGIIITIVAAIELLRLFVMSGYNHKKFFTIFVILFLMVCIGFLLFSQLNMGIILYTFLILSIFDAFSQISGQLFGKRHIAPSISPNKTLEGFIGGALVALSSSSVLREISGFPLFIDIFLAGGIIFFAFLGDLASSLFKRKYGVKDFTNLLPGHGGFLDRFDSLFAGGAFVIVVVEFAIPNI
jgi:phosphatidate cytidylyltransferase